MSRVATTLLVLVLATSSCGGGPGREAVTTAPSSTPTSPAPTASPPSTPPLPSDSPSQSPTPRPEPVRGVDVSHHQGEIDWDRVRGDGIGFAYLKATEGSTFTDPRFAANWAAARGAGLRVGGYHYFNLCAPGVPQAEHFVRTLEATGQRATMPPALDLELLGSCSSPPPRGALLREVRAYLGVVERATGQEVVVYAFPELELVYRTAEALDRRQWVRRIGDRPPTRDWWLWQRDDAASVAGIAGPADLNQLVR